MYHWMYFLHVINSDRQTRLLNALRQIAMILGDLKKMVNSYRRFEKSYCLHLQGLLCLLYLQAEGTMLLQKIGK
jgi:hypothetical protein